MLRKRMSVLLIAALAFTASVYANGGQEAKAGGTAPAQQKIVFRVGLNNPEAHPLCQGMKHFGEILSQKTNGRMSFQLYYGGQLGDKNTELQALQTGTLDFYMIMSGTLVDYGAKDLGVFILPYLFKNVQQARDFEKSPAGRKLFDSVQSSGTRMVCLGAYQESARNYFFTKTKVTKVSQMKGLKIRSQEGSMYNDIMAAFGASPESIAFSELYSALQTGIVDGAEQPLSGFYNNQYQQVAKYYLLDGHEISPNLILISEMTWNKLSAADKKIVQDAFNESIPYFEKLSDSKDSEILATMKKAGVDVYPPDNPQEWQDIVQPIYQKYGAEWKDVIAQIRATK
jgi:tripartite ATP-independent transporter DctP family solute receptor